MGDDKQIHTSDLNVAAPLSGSTFLQAITTITGTDHVGNDASAQSLEIADEYSLTLLTVCSHEGDTTKCGTPKFGLNFDPRLDLHMSGSMVQTSFSGTYSDQIKAYNNISMFLAVGYVLGAGFAVLSLLFMFVAACFPRAIVVSMVFQTFSAIFLLAATIGATVTFYKLRDAFNAALWDAGIRTELGRAIFGLSYGSAALAWFTVAFLVHFRKRNSKGKSSKQAGAMSAARSVPRPGFLKKIPTWKDVRARRYVEIEKQTTSARQVHVVGGDIPLRDHVPSPQPSPLPVPSHTRSTSRSGDDDREALIAPRDEDITQVDLGYNPRDPHARYDSSPRGRSISPMPGSRKKGDLQADTAYEPYRQL